MFNILWCQTSFPVMSPHLKCPINVFVGVALVKWWNSKHVVKGGAFAHTCTSTHAVGVLFEDAVQSSQGENKKCEAAMLLFECTVGLRGSAVSNLMISSDIKQKYYSAHVFSHWQGAATSSNIQVYYKP